MLPYSTALFGMPNSSSQTICCCSSNTLLFSILVTDFCCIFSSYSQSCGAGILPTKGMLERITNEKANVQCCCLRPYLHFLHNITLNGHFYGFTTMNIITSFNLMCDLHIHSYTRGEGIYTFAFVVDLEDSTTCWAGWILYAPSK